MMTDKMKCHDEICIMNKGISVAFVPSLFSIVNSLSYSRAIKTSAKYYRNGSFTTRQIVVCPVTLRRKETTGMWTRILVSFKNFNDSQKDNPVP